MKTLLALVLLLLPNLLHAASSATVNGEVLVAPTNLVLRSVDPAKGTLRIILPSGMYTNGFAVYDSSSNLLFGVSSNGAFQAFSPWSVLGSSTNLMTGTNLPGADGDVLTKGPAGLFMATPTGGGGGSSTNGLATTNFVIAGDAATSNHLETAKQPASITLTNLSNTGAITNVADAGNAFISWIYTSNNFTILLKTISAGANLWITNNGTNIVIAGPSTNGFVTQTITNGLATISYVNGATQGLVTASVTNGLATISYVDTKLNSTSNSLLSQIISSQVWTNDGQFIYWSGQPAVVPNSATPGPMFFLSTNGGMFIGQHVNQDTDAVSNGHRTYESLSFTDSNEPPIFFFSQVIANNETYGFYDYWSYNMTGDKDNGRVTWVMESSLTNGTEDTIFAQTDPSGSATGTGFFINRNNSALTKLYPAAPNDGTVPYLFGTSVAKTSGNLFIVTNFNGTVPLRVQFDGLHYGAAGNGITFQDTASTGGLQLFADDVGRPMMRFDTAGGIELSLQTKNRLARLNAQTNLVSSSYDETDFALASTTNLFATIVNLNTTSNAIVNIATNNVRVAPGAGTAVATNYENGGVTYVVSDSEVASTMVLTNFVLNQVYTNTSVQPILVGASVFWSTPGAVNGDVGVDLMYSQAGATGYSLLRRSSKSTLVTGIAETTTNTISSVMTNLGSYYFTNISTGTGNSAGLVSGSGQYTIIGGGAQGPTGAAGTSGTSGITNFQFGVNIDGAGAPIATGLKNSFIYIDKPTTLHQWFIVTDVASTVTVDVYKTNFTQGVNGFRPGSGLTICGGNKPSTTSLFSSNNALTSWTVTTLVSNDVLFFNVDSATSATYAKIWLQATSP